MIVPYTIYPTNSHILPSLKVMVAVATGISLNCMALAMFLGGGVWLGMAALLIPMFIVFGVFSGSGEYILEEKGIHKNVRPALLYRLFKYESKAFCAWSDVVMYKTGKDMTRSLQEYEFIEIKIPKNITWQITSQSSKMLFENFKSEFIKAVKSFNQQCEAPESSEVVPSVPQPVQQKTELVLEKHSSHHIIEQKKSFYETRWAKPVYLMLAVFFSGIVGFLIFNQQYFSLSNIFRISFVVIPGMVYFGYRIYTKKKV